MKPAPEDKWEQLAARARADAPPPLALTAALQAARTAAAAEPPPATVSWLEDFNALFTPARRLAGCGGLATLAVASALWFGVGLWTEVYPWAELLNATLESAS